MTYLIIFLLDKWNLSGLIVAETINMKDNNLVTMLGIFGNLIIRYNTTGKGNIMHCRWHKDVTCLILISDWLLPRNRNLDKKMITGWVFSS